MQRSRSSSLSVSDRPRLGQLAWAALAIVLLLEQAIDARHGKNAQEDSRHRPLDVMLDLYVRDGLVYYRALQSDRRRLDEYVNGLNRPDVASRLPGWSHDQQIAFWVNAYNAFVLETVINRYPIRGGSPLYPSNSIRQIPGAFERIPHRVAGRSVTLDEIEKTVLPTFRDPRVYLALGRGAVGSGRLRSEAFAAGRLETQLQDVARECSTERAYFEIDRDANKIWVTPIIGWRADEFAAAYASAGSRHGNRSPIERAILALAEPFLFASELDYLDANTFAIGYREFDWRLNDLTGGRP